MMEVAPDGQSVLLILKTQPGARRNQLSMDASGRLRVQVTAVAEKGKANEAILALLADRLRLAKSRIVLEHGATSTTKRFRIHCPAATFETKWRELLLSGQSK